MKAIIYMEIRNNKNLQEVRCMDKEDMIKANKILLNKGDDFWRENDWILEEMTSLLREGGFDLELVEW